MNKIPVKIRHEDGMPTGAMRGVENLIWRDNDTICAEGTANPWVGELRCFAVTASSPSAYYAGVKFSVCAKSSLVAHYSFRFEESRPVELQVGGKTVATLPAVPFHHVVNPVWSDDCKVVFGVIRDARNLAIWSVSIGTGQVSRATVPATGRILLSRDPGPGYVFDSFARMLRRIPSKSEEKLAASRKAFKDRFQAAFVDWFPSTPEVPVP
jgi:hypothetical protein